MTRNLIKRQVYAAAARAQAGLSEGIWLVRLRQAFAPSQYPSAASDVLRTAVRQELDKLFSKASYHAGDKSEAKLERKDRQIMRQTHESGTQGCSAS